MSAISLPFSLADCIVDDITTTDTTITITAHSIRCPTRCPRCDRPSERVHSHYTRAPRDLPILERIVRLALRVQRLFCDNPACPQRTFAERLPDIVPVHAQRTARLTRTLQGLAFALSGEEGARVVTQLHMPTSGDTLLRLVRQTPLPTRATPRVLGVDDFALRRGRVYGTVIVDLEAHQAVDMLVDRTADRLAAWLREPLGVEVISRDRSTEYARGATEGAPHAVQVADRWHLIANLREALERVLNRQHAHLRELSIPADATALDTSWRPRPRSVREQADQQARRERRYALYQAVQNLARQGLGILPIAKQLGLNRSTVRKFVYSDSYPDLAPHHRRATMLAPHEAYLRERWATGCHNGLQLWRELEGRGFSGSRRQVALWTQRQREQPAPTTPKKYLPSAPTAATAESSETEVAPVEARPRLPTPRRLSWLLVREPHQLDAEEQGTLAHIRQDHVVNVAYDLAQQFCAMVRQRSATDLDTWLSRCIDSQIPDLQSFATGLQREYASIRAALTEVWSNGQLEGQVNRLKLIKRQMYGRAGFDLLRQRFLHAA